MLHPLRSPPTVSKLLFSVARLEVILRLGANYLTGMNKKPTNLAHTNDNLTTWLNFMIINVDINARPMNNAYTKSRLHI